jgi:adsorption protein B
MWPIALLALWTLLSGLDDLFITLVFWFGRGRRLIWPSDPELAAVPERRVAILVPLWKEHRVIGQMLERNLSVLRYSNYDVFVGVYPNDEPTIRAVNDASRLHSRVHPIQGPRNGPTSKGDCLNWVYHGMQQFEERSGVRFEIIVTHDAEDLIHPDSLRYINWFSRDYDMVQVPVLPLPTGLLAITHGIYCDEFAEFQSKDIPVRRRLRGFLPANGVGTGFSRAALDAVAARRNGRIFDPESLTEDYETGYRLYAMGCTQVFLPLHFESGLPMATREYFPRRLRAAIRQRSRWVAGIALQGWERHGWRGSWRDKYWFWRDRKGLVGNLLAPLTNVLFLCGILRTRFGPPLPEFPHALARACTAIIGVTLVQMLVRIWACARIYGPMFAFAVPLRMLWANFLNAAATLAALRQFWKARRQRRTLPWLKTDHDYPAQLSPEHKRQPVGQILVKMQCVSMQDLEEALESRPSGVRIGEHLVISHKITEESLYQALSSQGGIPLGLPDTSEVNPLVTRMVPAGMARRWKVIPYRVADGELHVLTAELPSQGAVEEMTAVCKLGIRFRLVRPAEFDALALKYWPHS